MLILSIALGSLALYVLAYHTYGRWLARRAFALDDSALVPSRALNDDHDFVPTPRSVVFGHHFTSIAGTGPIVGPAIAVMWGWVPALVWVLLGSILIGAVHDLGALVISLRSQGQTVGDIAGRVINPRARILFLLILLLALTVVLAIFGIVIAAVFRQFPASIFPCVAQVPIAIAIGVLLHRRGIGLLVPSLVALAIMYFTVVVGDVGWLGRFNLALAEWSRMTWVVVLLVYCYAASVLPVWMLLQSRDYINSLQLLSALALVLVGLAAAAFFGGAEMAGMGRPPLEMVAPAVEWNPAGAPAIFPFLFITIACGAVSGFHCLVSSGTSSKQLAKEGDALLVGYGSMLTEGYLAVIVILACGAGLGLGILAGGESLAGEAVWRSRYASWGAAGGLGAMVGAFVDGSANFLRVLGVPAGAAVALMGVLVASFAGTTLDTACRLQRYVIQELAGALRRRRGRRAAGAHPLRILTNAHGATILAVLLALGMAALPAGDVSEWTWSTAGTGGMLLWPMFGAVNQLIGGLAFLVIVFWLWRRGRHVAFAALPGLFMLVMPAWAMISNLVEWSSGERPNWLLVGVALATILLEAWMVAEALLLWRRARGVLEEGLPPLPQVP
ncbi:MAG: carbon starvation CstA family protein [Planctomycetota bacterium]